MEGNIKKGKDDGENNFKGWGNVKWSKEKMGQKGHFTASSFVLS